MRKILFMTTAVVAFSAVTAQAADLPRRNRAPEPYYQQSVPTFTWTGFYIGANAGYGFAKFTGAGATYFGSDSNAFIGLTAGYNYQAERIVVGVEADGALTNMKGTGGAKVGTITTASSGKVSSFGTLRGRVGYAWDRALFYGTLGFAGANVKGNTIAVNSVGSTTYVGSGDHFHVGYAIGVGLEYALTRNISAKAEYLYASMGKSDYFSAPNVVNSGVSMNILRAGVNYRF